MRMWLGAGVLGFAAMSLTSCKMPEAGGKSSETYLMSTVWQQAAGEYPSLSEQAFHTARLRLDQALKDKRWTAAKEQEGMKFANLPPAIVTDIDETLLDNSPAQASLVLSGQDFTEENWNRWVDKRAATPLAGAREFIDYAVSKGVKIFYVTNRTTAQELATRENLVNQNFPVDGPEDYVLVSGEQKEGEEAWTSDKTKRREYVARTHRIVLLMGDDLNDFFFARTETPEPRKAKADEFKDMWGVKWIILPNAIYGSWEESLYGRKKELPAAEKSELKKRYLRGF